jgi:uncharacterized protein (TIGR00251 family)
MPRPRRPSPPREPSAPSPAKLPAAAEGQALRAAEAPGGVEVELHVQPRASADAVGGLHGGGLCVRVRAAPQAGAANAAVCRALARALGVAAQAVVLRGGAHSRRKRVRVQGEGQLLLPRLHALARQERRV